MENTGEHLEKLLEQVASREQKGRKRAFYISLLPLTITIILIIVTGSLVVKKTNEYNSVKHRVDSINTVSESARLTLDSLTRKIDTVTKMLNIYSNTVQQLSETRPAQVRQTIDEAILKDTTVSNDFPTVYIHIQAESQRDIAKQIADQLQMKGFIVPGIENTGKDLRTNDIRYFYDEDKGRADEIASILSSLGVKGLVIKKIATPGGSQKVRTGQFEIWFGNGFQMKSLRLPAKGS